MQSPPDTPTDTPAGIGFALCAYGIWGLFPLFLKLVDHIPTVEVVAHRVIWSLPVAALALIITGRIGDIAMVLRQPRLLTMGALTAGLVSANWAIFVWAIAHDRTLDAALGYYINPLFSVALGAIALRERLTPSQWVAVGLAGLAVAVMTAFNGVVPWVSILLALTFGLYGFFRKTLPLGPNQGFFIEVALLMPPAIGFALWLGPDGHFGTTASANSALMLSCGVITALPLIFYGQAAKRLRLSTIGILQYLVPTMMFLTAVLIFDEPLGMARKIAFPLIWLALALYTASMLRGFRTQAV